MVVPYTKASIESFKNIYDKMGIQVHFEGGNTIRIPLVAPKDKDNNTEKSGVIYRSKGDRLECNKEYTRESERTSGERLKEDFRAPSPIYDHINTTGDHTQLDNFSIVGRSHTTLLGPSRRL